MRPARPTRHARAASQEGDGWKDAMHAKGLRWDHGWENAPEDPFKAIDAWLAAEPKVLACRDSLQWPRHAPRREETPVPPTTCDTSCENAA